MQRALALAELTALGLAGCDDLPIVGSKYSAEVGYFADDKQAWHVWVSYSLEECLPMRRTWLSRSE